MSESHLTFGGMDVDVHLIGWAIEVDDGERVPPLHKAGFVASANRLEEGAGAHRSVVDEDVDVVALSSGDVGRADPTAPALGSGGVIVDGRLLKRDQFRGLCPHDVVEPVKHVVGRRHVQQRPLFRSEMERAARMGQGVVDHHVDDTGGFRFGSPLKGQACRRVPEEMFHGDEGPVSHPHRLNGRFDPVFHHDAGPRLAGGFARDLQTRNHADARQGFASETKG